MGEDWDVMFARPRPLTRQGEKEVGRGGAFLPTLVISVNGRKENLGGGGKGRSVCYCVCVYEWRVFVCQIVCMFLYVCAYVSISVCICACLFA